MTIMLVQGTDPSLRDREVQRVIDELLGAVDRSLALDDHTVESRRRGASADTEPADDEPSSSGSLELPAFTAIVNALQSPPFMTECRVVVVREIGNLTSDQAKWLAEWMADPLPGVHLVLVLGGGRVAAALDKAVKALADVVGPAGEQTAAALASATKAARLKLSSDAATRIASHFGDDAGRVPELVELLRATYGTGATLGADDVEAYLGELGTAGRFDLTNAIDRGELGAALEVLHRLLTATSASQPKPLHPMQVMASLVFHYQRLLRLDDPSITTKEQAASVLGMKSAGGARFPLDAARRLGSDGLREALALLAQAELDLRGQSGLDERTAIDVLVARLAALSRRHSRGTTRATAARR
jgi:DNA polymerase-3 subunit delta